MTMKYSVYLFLVSSGMIASTSLGFTNPTEKNLDSSTSYNGNTASSGFSPLTTSNSNGTQYICTGDVCIMYAGTGSGTNTALSSSCFKESQGDLSFVGNGYSLCFDHVNASSSPSVIEVGNTSKNLSLSGFSLFSCTSCPPGATGNGAIKSSGTTTFSNDATLLFEKNCSTNAGGAISCQGLTLQGTSISASFIGNTSKDNGGAIESTESTNLTNNVKLLFSQNNSEKAGGALHSSKATTFSGNASVVFQDNMANNSGTDGKGGAICCTDTSNNNLDLKFEGNKELIFSGNSSTTSGGAIYADKLTIVTGGPTLFTRNSVKSTSSPTGGAICINSTNGECSLTAELGDLIFDGNTIITTSGSTTTKRNAIDLGTSGKFTKLNAREGYGIYFYDPIANNGDTATTLELNKASGSDTYTGQIVFSGEKLSASEKAEADNLKSYFKQPIKVDAGSLVLRDGVTLEAKKVEIAVKTGENGKLFGAITNKEVAVALEETFGVKIDRKKIECNIKSLGEHVAVINT